MSDSIVFLFMSHKLSKELVNQFCEDTPFLAGEVQRLWRRFQALDSAGGGDGALTLAVNVRTLPLPPKSSNLCFCANHNCVLYEFCAQAV